MKKLLVPGIVIVTILSLLLSGCSGTPKAPVGKLLDLDKLVTENMTVDQVNALLKPALKQTGTLYQAESIELTAKGNWIVDSKSGGFAAGEEGPYQVLFFTPVKVGTEYYLVFFKDNAVMAKVWFSAQYAPMIEKTLKGE
jgi:hypothetical protein